MSDDVKFGAIIISILIACFIGLVSITYHGYESDFYREQTCERLCEENELVSLGPSNQFCKCSAEPILVRRRDGRVFD